MRRECESCVCLDTRGKSCVDPEVGQPVAIRDLGRDVALKYPSLETECDLRWGVAL